eukprot:m.166333 g.166333  ORF g.166333 m.166333 type:complete len:656 (+) comp13445_c4_seq4:159-2126(+)
MIVQNMGAYQTRPSLEKEVEEGADQYQRAYACGSMQGWRKSQEDAYVAIPKEDEYSIFGVFDGHGGSEVSALVANNFVQMLHKHCGSEWHKDIPASVTRTFKMMDLYAKSKEGQDEMKRILQLGEVQHYLLHSNLLLSTLTCCSFNCSIVSFSLSSFVLIMHLDVVGPLHSFYKKKKDTDTVPEVDDDEVSKLQEEAVMPLEILVGSRLRGVDGENEDTDKGNDTLEVPVEKLSEENPKKKPKSTTKSVEETSSSSSSSVSVTEATSSTATTSSITKTSTRKVRTLRRELTTTSLQKEKEDKDAKEVVKPLITVEEIAQANDESDESTQDSTQSTENDDSNGDCGEEEDASYDAKNHANSNGKDDDDDDDDGDDDDNEGWSTDEVESPEEEGFALESKEAENKGVVGRQKFEILGSLNADEEDLRSTSAYMESEEEDKRQRRKEHSVGFARSVPSSPLRYSRGEAFAMSTSQLSNPSSANMPVSSPTFFSDSSATPARQYLEPLPPKSKIKHEKGSYRMQYNDESVTFSRRRKSSQTIKQVQLMMLQQPEDLVKNASSADQIRRYVKQLEGDREVISIQKDLELLHRELISMKESTTDTSSPPPSSSFSCSSCGQSHRMPSYSSICKIQGRIRLFFCQEGEDAANQPRSVTITEC